MDANSLLQEAEQLYGHGNHGEAVARLTNALRSNPNEQDTQKIEALINKVGLHVFQNGGDEGGSREIGGGERGIGTQLASSFFEPSGSHNTQLGKLAMLGTVLAGSQKGSGGGGLQMAMSLLGGHQQSSGGGFASLASKFFSHGQDQKSSEAGFGGGPQQHHDTSTFSKLSSLAGSYVANQGGGHSGPTQHGRPTQQGGPGGLGSSNGSQEGQGKFGAVAAMAGNYLSGHNSNSGRGEDANHGGGRNDGLSNLASVASNIMGHGPGRHEQPTAYGNPNAGDNGFNFTGGGHLGPM